MGFLDRLAAASHGWSFSVLGSVYLGPGHYLHLPAAAYMAVLAGGAIWTLVVAALAWTLFAPRVRAALGRGDRKAARELFNAFAAVYLALGAYVTFSYPPTTDEPHYLALTDSLANGRGLELSAEYAGKGFKAFYPAESIDPHVVIAPGGKMYSQHTLGIPLLIVTGYATAGRWGALFILALLAAALSSALFLLCRRAGVDAPSAAGASALAGATCPLLPASTLVFTEIPAALLSSAALLSLGSGLVPPLCGAVMPWLHPRYALLAAGLAALDIASSRRRGRAFVTWLAAAAASGAAFLAVYHGPALVAVLNVLTEKYPARLEELTAGSLAAVSFANPAKGAFAKLVDADFGLLPYAPWMLVFLPGITVAMRLRRFPHAWFLAGALTYLLVTCLFRNWGGSAYPGRTVVPLLPFVIPYLALGLQWSRGSRGRRVSLGILVALSLAISAVLTAVPVLRYTSGRDWLSARLGHAWYAAPPSWFPSFLHGPGWAQLAAGIVLAVLLTIALVAGKRGK